MLSILNALKALEECGKNLRIPPALSSMESRSLLTISVLFSSPSISAMQTDLSFQIT
jgi:hypothetical protein